MCTISFWEIGHLSKQPADSNSWLKYGDLLHNITIGASKQHFKTMGAYRANEKIVTVDGSI